MKLIQTFRYFFLHPNLDMQETQPFERNVQSFNNHVNDLRNILLKTNSSYTEIHRVTGLSRRVLIAKAISSISTVTYNEYVDKECVFCMFKLIDGNPTININTSFNDDLNFEANAQVAHALTEFGEYLFTQNDS